MPCIISSSGWPGVTGSIARLNQAWSTGLVGFSDAAPPRPPYSTAAQSVDWLEFRAEALAEYVQPLYAAFRRFRPGELAYSWLHDVGLRGDEASRFGSIAPLYVKVGDGINADPIVRPPDYAYHLKYFEVMGSFGKPVISKELSAYPRPWDPILLRRMLYENLGMGLHSVGLISWIFNSGTIDWGIKGTPAETVAAEVFGVLAANRDRLTGMWPARPAVRIFISKRDWLGGNWRSSWDQLAQDLTARAIPMLYCFDDQLTDTLLNCPALLALDQPLLSAPARQALAAYAAYGGALVTMGSTPSIGGEAQHLTGSYNSTRAQFGADDAGQIAIFPCSRSPSPARARVWRSSCSPTKRTP